MTRIFRSLLAFFVAAMLILALFACNSLDEQKKDPPPEPPTEDTLAPPETVEDTESETAHESDSVIVYPELELPENIDALIPSMIKLYCYDYDMNEVTSHGTGFFIDDKGTFITNAHVVKDAYYVRARVYTGELYEVDAIYSYSRTASDHAICAISGYASIPVEFDPTAELGEKVYALGYPGSTFKFYASEGEVVNVEQTVGSITYIENTAVIFDGNSGGILANADGKILGITTGSLRGGEFLAVTYSEFAADLEKRDNPRSILERFHPRTDVALSLQNVESFFKITALSESENNPPMVMLSLRDSYDSDIVDVYPEGIAVTLTLVDGQGETAGEPLVFRFTSREDIVNGVTLSLDSSALPKGSFSVKISDATGTLVLYD